MGESTILLCLLPFSISATFLGIAYVAWYSLNVLHLLETFYKQTTTFIVMLIKDTMPFIKQFVREALEGACSGIFRSFFPQDTGGTPGPTVHEEADTADRFSLPCLPSPAPPTEQINR